MEDLIIDSTLNYNKVDRALELIQQPDFKISYTKHKILLAVDVSPSVLSRSENIIQLIMNQILDVVNSLTGKGEIYLGIVLLLGSQAPLRVVIANWKVRDSDIPEIKDLLSEHLRTVVGRIRFERQHVISDLIQCLNSAQLCLNLMPYDAVPHLVLYTDTVMTQFRDMGEPGSQIGQFRLDDIRITVVNLFMESKDLTLNFGYIGNRKLFNYMCATTQGSFAILAGFNAQTILNPRGILSRDIQDHDSVKSQKEVAEFPWSFDAMIGIYVRGGFEVLEAPHPKYVRLAMLWAPSVWLVVKCVEQESQRIVRKFMVSSSKKLSGTLAQSRDGLGLALAKFIRDMKSIEQLISYIGPQVSCGQLWKTLSSIPSVKWHRWFDTARIDILVNYKQCQQIRNEIRSVLAGWAKNITKDKPDFFMKEEDVLPVDQQLSDSKGEEQKDSPKRYILLDLVTENYNKMNLVIAFHEFSGRDKSSVIEELSSLVSLSDSIMALTRPLYLIESSNNISSYLLKSYCLKSSKSRLFESEESAKHYLNLIFQSRVRSVEDENFWRVGKLVNLSLLFVKAIDMDHQVYAQYLIQKDDKRITSSLYMEPDFKSEGDQTEQDIFIKMNEHIEKVDDFIYNSLIAFSYFMLRSLQHRLCEIEEDSHFENTGSLGVTELDFMYINMVSVDDWQPPDSKIENVEHEIIDSLYAQMYEMMEQFEGSDRYLGTYDPLLKHSIRRSMTVELPSIDPRQIYQSSIMTSVALTDFNKKYGDSIFFWKYICKDTLIYWIFPEYEVFLDKIIREHNFSYYICQRENIGPNNLDTPTTDEDFDPYTKSCIDKFINLLNRVSNTSVFIKGVASSLINGDDVSIEDFEKAISHCDSYPRKVDGGLAKDLVFGKWSTIDELVALLIYQAVEVSNGNYSKIDDAYATMIFDNFERFKETDFYYTKSQGTSIFLRSNMPSMALVDGVLELTLYVMPDFFRKEVEALLTEIKERHGAPYTSKDDTRDLSVLQNLARQGKSIFAEVVLSLLAQKQPIEDEDELQDVIDNMANLLNSNEFTYQFDLVNLHNSQKDESAKLKDCRKLVIAELEKNKVIETERVGNTFFVLSNSKNSLFRITDDMKNEINVKFWLLMTLCNGNEINVRYYLPKEMEYKSLTPALIQEKMISDLGKIQRRINQTILLRQVFDTHYCPSSLMPGDKEKELPSKKEIDRKLKRKRQSFLSRKLSEVYGEQDSPIRGNNPEASNPNVCEFHLPRLLSTQFKVSSRLGRYEALDELLGYYGRIPFTIYNRKHMFTLSHGNIINIFTFQEIVDDPISAPSRPTTIPEEDEDDKKSTARTGFDAKDPSNSNRASYRRGNSQLEEKQYLRRGSSVLKLSTPQQAVKAIQLNIYGCDPVPYWVSEQFEQNVNDILSKLSQQKLAEFTLLNTKCIMSVSDAYFIKEGVCRQLTFSLPSFIQDFYSFLTYYRQTMGRFLIPYKIRGCDMFVPFEEEDQVQQRIEFDKNEYLLLYNFFKAVKANKGEQKNQTRGNRKNLGSCLEHYFGNTLALVSPRVKNLDGEVINFFDHNREQLLQPIEDATMHTLELKLHICGQLNKSSLNEAAFEETVHTCTQQTIDEYQAEIFFQNYEGNPQQAIEIIKDHLPNGITTLQHYCPPFTLWDLWDKVVKIVNDTLDGVTAQMYIEKGEKLNNIDNLKQLQNINRGEVAIGRDIALYITVGPEAPEIHKNYPSEGSTIRNLFVAVIIDKKYITLLSYNLNKSVTNQLNELIVNEIEWTHQRYRLLNNALMQRLGLFNHGIQINLRQRKESEGSGFKLQSSFASLCPAGLKRSSMPEQPEISDKMIISHTTKPKNSAKILFIPEGLQGFWAPSPKHTEDKTKRYGCWYGLMVQNFLLIKEELNSLRHIMKHWFGRKHKLLNHIYPKAEKIKLPLEIDIWNKLRRHVRIIHSDKAAFYFALKDDSPESRDKVRKTAGLAIKNYAAYLIKTIPHLEKLRKMKRQNSEVEESWRSSSSSSFSSSASQINLDKIDHEIYLRKVYDHSIIVMHFTYESFYISCTIYCLEDYVQVFPRSQREVNETNEVKSKEFQVIKSSLKITAFAYDEMIFRLCQYMRTNSPVYPYVNILDTLNTLFKNFNRAPQGAKNSYFKGLLTIDLGDMRGITPNEIVEYLISKCEDYGFVSLRRRNHRNLFFSITDPHLSPRSSTIPRAPFNFEKSKGTSPTRIVLCSPATEDQTFKKHRVTRLDERGSDNKISIFYYILNVVDKSDTATTITQKEMKLHAQQSLERSIRLAQEHYNRDRLWDRISDMSTKTFLSADLNALLQKESSVVQKVEGIDNKLKSLTSMSTVFDEKLFDYLCEIYSDKNKRLEDNDGIKLILIQSSVLFTYLVISGRYQTLDLYSVRKSEEVIIDQENDYITDVVNKIVNWLWISLTTIN